eukprot:2951391-Pyramimonas_sp.AAC.1
MSDPRNTARRSEARPPLPAARKAPKRRLEGRSALAIRRGLEAKERERQQRKLLKEPSTLAG